MDNKKTLDDYLDSMGYTEEQKTAVISDLSAVSPQLSPVLESWYSTCQPADYQYEGYSLFQLMEKYQMNYVAALLTMDWMIKEPLEAKKMLEKGMM